MIERPATLRRPSEASTPARPRVLLVDDDPQITAALRRQLRSTYATTSAEGALDALDLVGRADEPFAAVVSDLRMPGMGGLHFLEEIAIASPDTTRLLLTGYADVDTAIDALNSGNVFRFLCKPCDHSTLVQALDDAIEQHRLVTSEKELLQRTLNRSVDALIETLALANPAAFSRALRIRAVVDELLDAVEVTDRWHIEVASMLSQLGAVTLPSRVVDALHTGADLTADERDLVGRLPQLALDLIADIPRLDAVRATIAGLATPTIVAADLPLGARVLRAAMAVEELESGGVQLDGVLAALRGRVPLQDEEVVEALARVRGAGQLGTIAEVAIRELTVGMVLRSDVVTNDGLLLVGRGQTVSESLLARIENFGARLEMDAVVEVRLA